ncbi:hypothetical protein B6D51_05250 [Pseudomonas chlororaphis subsp. chlororaphis]|nr:hypothetical protein B6D51_05250 [Pseudomonas chlororaphis subsp. chlororaphis]
MWVFSAADDEIGTVMKLAHPVAAAEVRGCDRVGRHSDEAAASLVSSVSLTNRIAGFTTAAQPIAASYLGSGYRCAVRLLVQGISGGSKEGSAKA